MSTDPNISGGLEPAYISIAHAARYFGLSKWWVREEINHGRLESVRVGKKRLIVMASAKQRAADMRQQKDPKPLRVDRQSRGDPGQFSKLGGSHG